MKKTEGAGNYGVTLEDVKIQVHFENIRLKYICNFFVLLFGAYGTIKSFLSCFNFNINASQILMQIFLLCVFSFLLFQFVKHYMVVLGFALVSFIIYTILKYKLITMSMYTMLRQMHFESFEENTVGAGLFILILSAIVIIIMAYIVILKTNMILVSLCSLPILSVGMAFGVMPAKFPLLCIGMYIAAMAALSGDKAKYRNRSIALATSAAVIVFVLYSLVLLFLPEQNYEKIRVFGTIKTKIENIYNDLPFEGTRSDAVGGINGGELGKYDKISYSNKSILKLTTGDTGIVYLRSLVGSFYMNNSWSDSMQESERKYANLFKQLDNVSIELYNQTAELMKIIDNDSVLITSVKEDVDSYINSVYKRKFIVEYLSASGKYFYLPYGNVYISSEKSSLDGYPIGNKDLYIDAVSFTVKKPDYVKYKKLVDDYAGSNKNMIRYQKVEKLYRKYVNNTYLTVDSKYQDFLQKNIKNNSYISDEEKYKVILSIKDYLAENYVYTLEPGAVPQDKDFLDYFLFESKQGYCTYFATAATMLFRAAGIPTRYVEGYAAEVIQDNLISTNYVTTRRTSLAFNMSENYTEYSVVVQDNDAHAWVEIYQDGYGWVPIEVTPGKSDEIATGLISETTFTDKSKEENYETDNTYLEEEEIIEAPQEIISVKRSNLTFKDALFMVLNVLKYVLYYVIGILIIATIIFIPAKIKEKKRDKLFIIQEGMDNKLRVIMIYKYIEKICVFLKVYRPDSMSYIDYYSNVKAKYNYLDSAGIDTIILTALKVRFGMNDITEEKLNKVIESALHIRKETYNRLHIFSKIKYRLLNHLF